MTHDPKHNPEQQDAVQETPVNASRRKLTQASLAAPVVLGTLASRKVLAQDAWNCTISGQISGNVSRPGAVTCSSLGMTYETWKNSVTVTKSGDGAKKLSELSKLGLKDVYYYKETTTWNKKNNKLLTGTGSEKEIATLNQILTLTDDGSSPELEYGRKALLIWHNAKKHNTSGGSYNLYPISEADAVALFNALVTGNPFALPNGKSWGKTEVKAYIDLLYH